MASMIFLISVFVAGVLSFFSPCILPLLPVYAGLLLDTQGARTINLYGRTISLSGLKNTMCFVAGLSLVFVLLGYGAGFLGDILYAGWFQYLLGGLVILLGLHQMDLVTIRSLNVQKKVSFQKQNNHSSAYNAFFLGLTFSLGWTPCIGPVLSSVLALAASGGKGAIQGGLLMLIYALGLALPFLIVALMSSVALQQFNKLKPHVRLLKRTGGALIVVMGILLMFGNLNALASFLG